MNGPAPEPDRSSWRHRLWPPAPSSTGASGSFSLSAPGASITSFFLRMGSLQPSAPRRDDANGEESPENDVGSTMDTAVHALSGTEEERASRRLIEQMSTILAGLRDDIPAGFAEELFARAAAEDLLGCEPRELATLAEDAWAFLTDCQPGAPKMRFESRPRPVGAERIKSVSVLEIVNDDMPFLLDSVLGELNERGIEVRLVVHPVFTVERDESGVLFAFRGEGHAAGLATRESFIHIHTARIDDEGARAEVVQALEQVLADVRVCVQDWKSMLSRLQEVIAELKNNPPPVPIDEVAEAVQFLEWLAADNFTFLGFRSYAFPKLSRDLAPEFETGLGILRAPDVRVLRRGNDLVSITPEIMEFLNEPKTLIITKANVRSRIHRRVHMDYIGVKHFDIAGISSASTASSGCSPPPSTPARHARFPICGAGSPPRCRAPASIPMAIRARRSPMCWRPIPATSCSRSTRTRSITMP